VHPRILPLATLGHDDSEIYQDDSEIQIGPKEKPRATNAGSSLRAECDEFDADFDRGGRVASALSFKRGPCR